ncbi:hypothetical protein, partial [Neobacillus sp. LXY-1]|uniref:hypothetical protein n=1 Tax=Neobacillus sp. LXY-1 TaxID=3379133 RepID=UPI003EE0E7E3
GLIGDLLIIYPRFLGAKKPHWRPSHHLPAIPWRQEASLATFSSSTRDSLAPRSLIGDPFFIYLRLHCANYLIGD